jgi:Na+/H+ antiporter NhaD/arsenite permease-like protein
LLKPLPFKLIICVKYYFYPQVEQEPDEQELQELELELIEDKVFPVQNPQPLKILLISLLLHLVQDILPSSISLIVALTSKA